MSRAIPRTTTRGDSAGPLDVDRLLADRDRRIIVCCGAGGVGKTTTSAALALRAAEQGRKVVVLTIDPARRLAQSMGIEKLDNTPRPVPGVRGEGSLDAMMLDMKRTFDEVVESQASPEKAQQILANPFYVAVSSSFAGTQEYMAMEKLGQLHNDALKTDRWDLIVVDTPPSRNALDFLDAPERLSSFLDGRFMKLLLAPAKGPARLMSAGFGLVTKAITSIIGAQVLRDMQAFVAAFDTLFTVLELTTRAIAPLLPLTTEEIWRGLTGGRSVHLTDWPDVSALPADASDAVLVDAMDQIRAVCSTRSVWARASFAPAPNTCGPPPIWRPPRCSRR